MKEMMWVNIIDGNYSIKFDTDIFTSKWITRYSSAYLGRSGYLQGDVTYEGSLFS